MTDRLNDGQTKYSIAPLFQSGAINNLSCTSATNYFTSVPQEHFCSKLTSPDNVIQW